MIHHDCVDECVNICDTQEHASQSPPKWRNSSNFSYSEYLLPMKKFTGQNKFIAGRAKQLLINYCPETDQKANKEAFGDAPKLLQHYQLPDKNSRNISKDTWNFFFLPYFKKFFIYLFRDFSRRPLTMFCGTIGWETLF